MKKISMLLLALLLTIHALIGPVANASANELAESAEGTDAMLSEQQVSEEAPPEVPISEPEDQESEAPAAEPEKEPAPEPETAELPAKPAPEAPAEEPEAELPPAETEKDSDEVAEEPAPTDETDLPEEEKEEPAEDELADSEPSEIPGNILTSATVTLTDEEGKQVDEAGLETIISVNYTWALENGHGYKAGSTFNFNVPNELEIYEAVNKSEMKFNGQTIGYLDVAVNGQATVTFTKFIEEYSNIKGTISIWTKLSKEQIVAGDTKIIVTPIEGGDSFTIPVSFNSPGPAIEKKGVPNRVYNSETIEWTVDFNKNLADLENAVLKDPIQNGQKLDEGSIKVYELISKLDGSVSLGTEVASSEYSIGKTEGNDFSISFNGNITSAYRVVYTTEITDQDQIKFENKATLTSSSQQDASASASVTVQRGKALEKRSSAYDAAKQLITWEVKYNYNEKTIAKDKAKLVDVFSDEHGLVSDSFVVKNVTIDSNGKATDGAIVDNYTIIEGEDGFTLQFNEEIDSAYKIVYQTKASDRVFDKINVSNKVTTGNGESASGTKDLQQQILFKSNSNANYKDKTVDWTISFNHDNHEMNNVVLTDTFTNKGLTLLPKSLKIMSDGKALDAGTDYILVQDEDDPSKFIITFNHTITATHIITYKTEFNYEQRADKGNNKLGNHALLTWTNESGNEKAKDASSDFNPDNYTQSNGFKNGSYNAVNQEITWNIGVNYNLKELAAAKVEDKILGNQKVLKDTLTVYEMSLTGGPNGTEVKELVSGRDYSISWFIDDKEETNFIVEFKNPLTKPYMITYKTSLKDLNFVEASYSNTATLINGSDKETDLTANVTIQHGGKYISKSGTQNGKIIDWTANINFAQADITNAAIVDKPSADQMVLENSIRLYAAEAAANGTVAKGGLLEAGKDYTLTFNDKDSEEYSFELKFKNAVSEPYILEYQSFILKAPAQITNAIAYTGDHVKVEQSETISNIDVKRTAGMGDGSGELGGLKITKADSVTKSLLEGASFELKDKDSGIVIKQGVTDKTGTLQFDRLLFGEYLLVETEAPEGYLNNTAATPITIDKAFAENDPAKDGNKITVNNKKLMHAVQLEKVDGENADNKLKGANFILEKKTGDSYQVIKLLVTDENGLIYQEGLEKGEYRFIENIAPDGYQKDDTPIPFEITENQLEVIKLDSVKNYLIKGTAELTKVDLNDSSKVLQGAVFSLQDAAGKDLKKDLMTNEEGKIVVTDLNPGTYQFVETKAPFGYKMNAEPISFEIVESQNAIVKMTARNEVIPGSVELVKVDEDDEKILLEGAIFELQDGNGELIQSGISTNKEGKIIVSNLKPGNYQFVETKAPAYYQLDSTPHKFTIKSGDTPVLTTLTAPNKLVTGSVELTKMDKDDSKLLLEGAIFELQDAAGNTIKSELKTDKDGKITVTDLKPGEYQFVEMAAPFGYVLSKTPIPFTIEKHKTAAAVTAVKVKAENELATGSAVAKKVAAEDAALALQGAVFNLTDAAGKVLQTDLTTNENGEMAIHDLKPGAYQLIETAAPFGYQLDAKPIPFTIVKGQKETLEIRITNTLSTGAVELLKTDSDNEELFLEGAIFNLLDSQGHMLKEKLATDNSGKLVITDLAPGDYQLVETAAPFGYILDEKPISFTIIKGQTENLKLSMKNEAIRGAVKLLKVDYFNKETVLPGAEFNLLDASGKLLQEKLITDNEGKLTVENLKPGNYQFVETKAPSSYRLDATPVAFEIVKGQTAAVEVEKTNRRRSNPPLPVEPNPPADPEKPVDPETPTDPEKPVDPEEPTDPGTPVDPEKPIDPEKPADPEKPVDPETPTAPETPGNPETPVSPDITEGSKTPVIPSVKPATPPAAPGNAVSPVGNSTTDKVVGTDKLPQTGEESFRYLIIIGIVLLFFARRLLVRKDSGA